MRSIAIRLQELDDDELEDFVDIWLHNRAALYYRTERLGRTSDKGRDVVGFVTDQLHEGDWDLYQCKRKTRGSKLGVGEGLKELGKVFYHHLKGEYATLPRKYVFVSPRGITGPLQTLLLNKEKLRTALVDQWDETCRTGITRNEEVPLSDGIRKLIEAYDFTRITYLTGTLLAKETDAGPALSKVLNLVPDEAPEAEAPKTVCEVEMVYLEQLREIYGETSGVAFTTIDDVLAHPDHGGHLQLQRTRFFEAAAFDRFHRDNTAPGAMETFKKDVFHTVIEVYRESHPSRLDRINAVMKHIGMTQVSLLGRMSRTPVRQGMCHHLATDGRLRWTR